MNLAYLADEIPYAAVLCSHGGSKLSFSGLIRSDAYMVYSDIYTFFVYECVCWLSLARGTTHCILLRTPYTKVYLYPSSRRNILVLCSILTVHNGRFKPSDWTISTDKVRVIFIRRADLVRGISISEVGFITSLDGVITGMAWQGDHVMSLPMIRW